MLDINIFYILISFAIILASIVIHELAHGYASYFLGDDTAKLYNRLSLNPFKHLDPMLSFALPLFMLLVGGPIIGGARPVPVNARKLEYGDYGMALVALSGPLSNLVVAFLCFGLSVLFQDNDLAFGWLQLAVMVNLSLMLFNLIPIPPLDGSRVIYALLPLKGQEIFDQIERYGLIVIIVLLSLPATSSLLSAYLSNMMELIFGFFRMVFRV